MGYEGGSLVSLFGATAQKATAAVCPSIAHRAGERIEELAVANTPVDTGHLRQKWHRFPVVKIATLVGDGYRVEVANDADYAAYVENGTGNFGPLHRPYVITPKDPNGVLSWRDPKTGQWIHAKRVLHPGSPGNHMLAIALHVTEYEVDAGIIGRRELHAWASAVEAGAD